MKALEKYIAFETSDGKVIFVENYNKSHDSLGRFGSGGGSSSKILEKHNGSHGIKVNASDEYLKNIARLEKEGNIYKGDILLGDVPKFAGDVPTYKLLPTVEYDSSKLVVHRAGVIKGDVGAGSFFSVHEGVADMYSDETMAGRVRKTYSYKLKDNLKLVKANQRGEMAKRLGIRYDGNSQQTLEKLIAKDLRRMNYDGVIYDGINMTYGTRMSDQNGEVQLFNAKLNTSKIEIKKDNDFHDYHPVEAIQNKFDEESQGLIQTQQASLQNSIINIEGRIVQSIIDNLFKVKNSFKDEDIITKDEEESFKKELAIILVAYYGIIIPLFGKSTTDRRAKEFNLFTNFTLNDDIKKYIKDIAEKASSSHIQTTLKDVLDVVNETYNKNVQSQLEVIKKTRTVTDADLTLARKKALEGASQRDIINAIKTEFNDTISKVRAKTIARTETNRAFTQSQFQADLQFIKQTNLEGRAYKKWITRSDNPCAICLNLASQPPIPFKTNFADIGDELTGIFTNDKGVTKVIKQLVSFEDLVAGNAHVNCACVYQLIIEGFSENSFDKEQNYNKNHDPASGKFSSGGGSYEKINKDKIDNYISKQSIVGTEDDKSSLAYLIGGYSSHRTINSYYREGRFAGDIDKSKWMVNKFQNDKYEESTIGEITPKLDSLFAKNKVKSGIVVYRTMTLTKKESSQLTKGVVFKDLGYTSTTLDKEYANIFDKGISEIGKNQQRIVATIKVPKNTSGLFPSNVVSGVSHERELTLNRSTSFKVIDNKITDDTLNLELEVVNE